MDLEKEPIEMELTLSQENSLLNGDASDAEKGNGPNTIDETLKEVFQSKILGANKSTEVVSDTPKDQKACLDLTKPLLFAKDNCESPNQTKNNNKTHRSRKVLASPKLKLTDNKKPSKNGSKIDTGPNSNGILGQNEPNLEGNLNDESTTGTGIDTNTQSHVGERSIDQPKSSTVTAPAEESVSELNGINDTHSKQNDPLKRAKLSGAQKRKLKKQKRDLNQTLTSTPRNSMSGKRQREVTGSTGTIMRPAKKPDMKDTPSYSETLSKANLLIAIIDLAENNTLKMIEDEQYYKFLTAMQKLYIRSIIGNKQVRNVPLFTENRNIRSAIKIRCSDSSGRRWMEDFVPSIPMKELWEGANLFVIDFHRLPKPITANIWCPGVAGITAEILQLLQTCNPGLNTGNWSTIRKKANEKGASIKVGIDEKSKTYIEAKKNRLCFGIAQAIVYFPKNSSNKKKPAGGEGNPLPFTDTEIDTDVETETENEGNENNRRAFDQSMADTTVIESHPNSTPVTEQKQEDPKMDTH